MAASPTTPWNTDSVTAEPAGAVNVNDVALTMFEVLTVKTAVVPSDDAKPVIVVPGATVAPGRSSVPVTE